MPRGASPGTGRHNLLSEEPAVLGAALWRSVALLAARGIYMHSRTCRWLEGPHKCCRHLPQCQTVSFLVHRPEPATAYTEAAYRSIRHLLSPASVINMPVNDAGELEALEQQCRELRRNSDILHREQPDYKRRKLETEIAELTRQNLRRQHEVRSHASHDVAGCSFVPPGVSIASSPDKIAKGTRAWSSTDLFSTNCEPEQTGCHSASQH